MRKVILLLSVLAVIAAGWFLYFNKGETRAVVGVHEVDYGDLANTLEFSGEVVCTNMYSVMSETGGTVLNFYVTEGSRVKAGDKLFDLDSTAVEAQLQEAQLKLEALTDAAARTVMAPRAQDTRLDKQQQAAIALALSQTTGYDFDAFNEALGGVGAEAAAAAATAGQRLNELAALQNAGAAADSSNMLSTESQLKLAQLAVNQLKEAVDKMKFTSRIDGTVIAVNINSGEVLAPGLPAMVIADTDSTEIAGYVYEKDVDSLQVGMDVIIMTEGGNYTGKLTKIGNAAVDVGELSMFDTMTKVTIKPDEGFNKMPGAVVDLKIVLSAKDGVLNIPADCLTADGCVYVVDDGDIVRKRRVTTGFMDMFNVEVMSGLTRGERVVTSPDSVKEGQHVSYNRG